MSRLTCCGSGHLTPRQQELLVFLARGFTTGQIATRMHISAKTGSRMVSELLTVSGARNRSELIALACYAELLDVTCWPPTSGESTCLSPIRVR